MEYFPNILRNDTGDDNLLNILALNRHAHTLNNRSAARPHVCKLQASRQQTAPFGCPHMRLVGCTTYSQVNVLFISSQESSSKFWECARVAAPSTINNTLPICIVLRPGGNCQLAVEVKLKFLGHRGRYLVVGLICSPSFYTTLSFAGRFGGVAGCPFK